jgi:hypothetical protein
MRFPRLPKVSSAGEGRDGAAAPGMPAPPDGLPGAASARVAGAVTAAETPSPVERRHQFVTLLAATRLGAGPSAGPQLPRRALARLDADPFVRRLARME